MDWRVTLGLAITLLWFTAGLTYLLGVVGSNNFIHLPTADIGSFLEGAFAPQAFLWLVIGHFMQQKEISANTRTIKIQEQSARRLELHSRQDSYFKLLSLVQQHLGRSQVFTISPCAGPQVPAKSADWSSRNSEPCRPTVTTPGLYAKWYLWHWQICRVKRPCMRSFSAHPCAHAILRITPRPSINCSKPGERWIRTIWWWTPF